MPLVVSIVGFTFGRLQVGSWFTLIAGLVEFLKFVGTVGETRSALQPVTDQSPYSIWGADFKWRARKCLGQSEKAARNGVMTSYLSQLLRHHWQISILIIYLSHIKDTHKFHKSHFKQNEKNIREFWIDKEAKKGWKLSLPVCKPLNIYKNMYTLSVFYFVRPILRKYGKKV